MRKNTKNGRKLSAASRLLYLSIKFYEKGIPLLPSLVIRIIRVLFSCEVFYTIKIGEDFNIMHNGAGVVINHNAKIGNNCEVYQNVTIGGNGDGGVPQIGNNVSIYAGAVVLGGISIGDNVKIGANAVVLKDIPANAVAVGVPAKIVKYI